MLTYAKLALLVLQFAQSLLTLARNKQQMDAGVDAEIAKVSALILSETAAAKAVMVQVTGMTDAQVDETLRSLEP